MALYGGLGVNGLSYSLGRLFFSFWVYTKTVIHLSVGESGGY